MGPVAIPQVYRFAVPLLHERLRHMIGSILTRSYGRGGIQVAAQTAGPARSTSGRAPSELDEIATDAGPLG